MTKTDKRFHITVSNDNTVRLIDHKRSNDLISIGFKEHSNASDCSDALQYLCNLMNGLAEENEQLRKENDMFSCGLSVSANKEISRNCRIAELEEENKQLKQFKEDVFNKIDMHLRMLPTARDKEFNEKNGDPSLYTGAIYMLETLKKELSE